MNKCITNKTTYKVLLIFITALTQIACSQNERSNEITLENQHLFFAFDKKNGALISFRDKTNSFSFTGESPLQISPWEIEITLKNGNKTIDITSASGFRHRHPDDSTIVLKWNGFNDPEIKEMSVSAAITLRKNAPLSSWKINIEGIKGLSVSRVSFPRIKIIPAPEEEYLAVPEWMGQLLKNPRRHLNELESKKFEWSYPGPLSMQCAALYSPGCRGFYAACTDTLAYRKNIAFSLDSSSNIIYQIINFPSSDTGRESYMPEYDFTIGSFTGDWFTAAEMYRSWGTKQKWARESRFRKNSTPGWLEETSLWIWNRGKSSNVLVPAADLQEKLNLPVSVFWHWWHGCSYDDGFPEYMPPREGRDSFLEAMKTAHEKDINAIVYMNQALWGTTTGSWKSENAEKYAAKDQNGRILSHVFNIFSGKPAAYMCMGTEFWKNKYATLCDSAVNSYTADGVYMDMACLNTMCFDKSHGHPTGGGNYHLQNFGILTSLIRSKITDIENLVLAGEGAGEVWLPYLDLFLTLAVSKERYAGPGIWETIPFFQAVYHEYSITYGNYSSLLVPPYDELWPEQYAPAEPLKMLENKFSKQFLMEQARSFAWGLQPVISNYQPFLAHTREKEISYLINLARTRNNNLKYLLRGRFMRSPLINIPEEEFDISRLSIYAGKMGNSVTAFRGKYPLIYSGAWISDTNDLGIAVASISEKELNLDFTLKPSDYGIGQKGVIYVTGPDGRKKLTDYSGELISVEYTLNPREICMIEIASDNE